MIVTPVLDHGIDFSASDLVRLRQLKKRVYHAKYNRDQREKRWLSQIIPQDRPWTRMDLAWVAGVFEGEGCFSSGVCNRSRSFVARIAMTDADVVERVHAILSLGILRWKPAAKAHHKAQRTWAVSGFEDVQAVMAALWPWLGTRRRARVREILSLARAYFATPASNGLPRNRFRRAKRAA